MVDTKTNIYVGRHWGCRGLPSVSVCSIYDLSFAFIFIIAVR